MAYRIEDSQWNDLISKVDDFKKQLQYNMDHAEERMRERQKYDEIQRKSDEVKSENARLQLWRTSLEAKDLVAKSDELDKREAEIETKRKEIEALAYNKGYVAGYVEITQKLGKTS